MSWRLRYSTRRLYTAPSSSRWIKSSLDSRPQSLLRTSRLEMTWNLSGAPMHLLRVVSRRSVTASSDGSSSWTLHAILLRISKPIWLRLAQLELTQRRTNLRQVKFLASTGLLSSSKLRFLIIVATCSTRWPVNSLVPFCRPLQNKSSSSMSSSSATARAFIAAILSLPVNSSKSSLPFSPFPDLSLRLSFLG